MRQFNATDEAASGVAWGRSLFPDLTRFVSS